jgi:hypothetical protein
MLMPRLSLPAQVHGRSIKALVHWERKMEEVKLDYNPVLSAPVHVNGNRRTPLEICSLSDLCQRAGIFNQNKMRTQVLEMRCSS